MDRSSETATDIGRSGYTIVLDSLAGPMWVNVVFAAVNAACAVLLGHPWLAVIGFA